MNEVKISLIDKGKISQKCHLFEIGIHSDIDMSEVDAEYIAQKVKEQFLKKLKK